MEEKTLWKISLITVLLGLIILFFYTEKVELQPKLNLYDIPLDEEVKVRGKITSLRTSDKAIFLEIAGERVENVEAILFNDEEVYLEEGDYIEIEGKVEEYKGKREIIANEITLK